MSYTCHAVEDNGGYEYCDQDFFRSFVFPPLPRWQEQLGSKWMTSSQETITALYSWSSLVVVVLALGMFVRNVVAPAVESVFKSTYEVSLSSEVWFVAALLVPKQTRASRMEWTKKSTSLR